MRGEAKYRCRTELMYGQIQIFIIMVLLSKGIGFLDIERRQGFKKDSGPNSARYPKFNYGGK